MGIQSQLYAAMLKYVQAVKDPRATEVVEFRESAYDMGGCETCGPEYEYEVGIVYRTPLSSWATTYAYKGKFGDLLQALDQYSD